MKKSLVKRVIPYLRLSYNAFLQRLAYLDSTWINIIEGIVTIFLQICFWKALITSGQNDTTLEDMLAYILVNMLAGYLVSYGTANTIASKLEDGTVAIDMILPIDFKLKLFSENLGGNLYDCFFSGLPGVILAICINQVTLPKLEYVAGFVLTLGLGMFISYQITYLFGLSGFWIIKPWYIKFLLLGLTKLFGGMVIPFWFYPEWLVSITEWLPFKYITHISVEIYLGRYKGGIVKCVMIQLTWLIVLHIAEAIIWKRAKNKVFVQGG